VSPHVHEVSLPGSAVELELSLLKPCPTSLSAYQQYNVRTDLTSHRSGQQSDTLAMSSLIATWKPTYPYLYRPDSVRVKDYSLSHLELLRSGKYSDLTLRCGNAEWHVHRFVLCPRSKYFTAACDGDFEV